MGSSPPYPMVGYKSHEVHCPRKKNFWERENGEQNRENQLKVGSFWKQKKKKGAKVFLLKRRKSVESLLGWPGHIFILKRKALPVWSRELPFLFKSSCCAHFVCRRYNIFDIGNG